MINVEKILQLDYLEDLLLQIDEHIASEKEKIIKHYDISMLENMSVDEINDLFKEYEVKCDNLVHLFQDVYLDESLKRFEFVYPACGSSNSAIKLSIKEIEETSNYTKWIDVCKLIEK